MSNLKSVSFLFFMGVLAPLSSQAAPRLKPDPSFRAGKALPIKPGPGRAAGTIQQVLATPDGGALYIQEDNFEQAYTPFYTEITKITAQGLRDTTWGVNGRLKLKAGLHYSQSYMNPQGELTLLFFKSDNTPGYSSLGDFYLGYVNRHGHLNRNFGKQGWKKIELPGLSVELNAAIRYSQMRKHGSHFLVQTSTTLKTGAQDHQVTYFRFNALGKIDTAFGTQGIVRINYTPYEYESGRGLTVLKNGSFLGGVYPIRDDRYPKGGFFKMHANGSIDTSFADQGFLETPHTLIVENNDLKLTLIENYLIGSGSERGLQLRRVSAQGVLDTTFGNGGTVRLHLKVPGNNINSNHPGDVVLSPDGSLQVLSSIVSPERPRWDLAYAVSSFTANGVLEDSRIMSQVRTVHYPFGAAISAGRGGVLWVGAASHPRGTPQKAEHLLFRLLRR